MKLIYTLVALLISIYGFSQSPKQHILDRTSIGFGIRQTVVQGSHVYSVGTNQSVNQNYPSLVKQDFELNTVWVDHPVRPGASSKSINQVIKSNSDGLIMAGSADDNLWILKVDTLENIIWERELTTSGSQSSNYFLENTNGGGVLFVVEYNALDNDIQLINFDGNGDTLWTSNLSPPSGEYYRNPVGAWDNSNNLIINLRNGGSYSEIVKLDGSNGGVLDHFKFQDALGSDYYIRAVFNDGQNTYLAGSMNSDTYTSVIIKLNASENVVWSYNYPEIQRFFNIKKDNSGNLLLYGFIGWGEDLNLAQVLKIDENGNALKAMAYGKKPASHLMISNFVEINNHFILSGWRDYQSAKTAYQLCIDTNLYSGSCYEREISISRTSISSSKINIGSIVQSSLQTDISFFGTPSNPSYLTGGIHTDYNLDNSIQTSFDIIGDDCGGTCNGVVEAIATGGDPGYIFNWSNGQTSSIANNLCANSAVMVRIGDQLGCYVYDTIIVPQIAPITDVCMVTVDSTSTKNEVVWEKPISGAIEGFTIYRDIVGNYGLVGYVPYDSLSKFVDNTNGVNPNITSYRYKIATLDTCGNESELSDYHETIHLTVNQGSGSIVNLIWDGYEGFSFSYNRILIDSLGDGNWQVIDSVSSNVFTWTNNNSPSDTSGYMIEVVTPNTCTAAKAQDHNTTRSNRHTVAGPSSYNSIQELILLQAKVYPNPSKGLFTINLKSDNWSYSLFDMSGKLISTESVAETNKEIDIQELEIGIYLIKINLGESSVFKKIVKQ